ncbi:MAG: NfeD family protein [Burkholderiales bacterium]|nr:NfeD family protein [Burkholderiales bacterium]
MDSGERVEPHVYWFIAGFLLVIAELTTGTFYLVVLGVAAFAGGAVAWTGAEFWLQAVASAVVAIAGAVWVHHWRAGVQGDSMPPLDFGQPAAFESWVSREERRARVQYRNTQWDAIVEGAAEAAPGEVFYIVSVDGNTLKVSKTRPA